MKRIGVIVGLMAMAVAGFTAAPGSPVISALNTNEDKITICHASGQEGTLHFETLTLAPEAVFGEAGHFFENGTPRAGHEQDYMGPCTTDTTTTTTTTTTEPTDVCPNIEGIQETVPPGMGIVNGQCVPVDINPQCAPPGVIINGVCVVPPPPPSDCPPGMIHDRGHDGNPGNDDCCFPGVNCDGDTTSTSTTTTTTTTPPPTTTTTDTTTTDTTTTTVEPTTGEETTANPPKQGSGPKAVSKPHKPKKKHKQNKMPPVCPVGVPTNQPCAVQGSG